MYYHQSSKSQESQKVFAHSLSLLLSRETYFPADLYMSFYLFLSWSDIYNCFKKVQICDKICSNVRTLSQMSSFNQKLSTTAAHSSQYFFSTLSLCSFCHKVKILLFAKLDLKILHNFDSGYEYVKAFENVAMVWENMTFLKTVSIPVYEPD